MPRSRRPFGADSTAKTPAWLNDPPNYHDRGDVDFASCSQTCLEQGDFFGLDDLFTEQPVVMQRPGGHLRRLDQQVQARRLPRSTRHGT